MLSPSAAHKLLIALLNIVMVGTAAALIFLMVTLFSGPPASSQPQPATLHLMLGDVRYRISHVSFQEETPLAWRMRVLLVAALLVALLLAYGRLRSFLGRLMDDPFQGANIRDLRLASWVALGLQGVGIVLALLDRLGMNTAPDRAIAALKPALAGVPDVTIIKELPGVNLNALSVFGLDFSPLAAAAALAILAAVLQRGHDLREEERRLRREQELTV